MYRRGRARSSESLAGKVPGNGLLSHSPAAPVPGGPARSYRGLREGDQHASRGGGEEAKWPLGAPAREGHGRQVAPAGPLSARLPQPLARPTPSAAPARGRRESGAAAARTWAGRRWGGEEGRTQPGPPCPLAPGRERREQDIPCPGTREGRGGLSRTAEQHPWLGGAPPAAPRGRRANRATPPPSSPGPHDSALGAGRRGTGMAPSLQAQAPPPPVGHSSFYLAFPHLPSFCRRPPPPLALPGKGNRNQEGGV